MFVGIAGVLVVIALVLMTAAFVDRTEPGTFPRWFGYFNAWFALLELPPATVVIFNDGPLAWNGIIAFWIPLVAFAAWFPAVTVVLLQSITAEQAAEPVTAAAP
jgi:hypothetical protein